MNLFQEYEKQQKWRGWERYLQFIPISQNDSVVDLGCSVGDVSRFFSRRVKNVVGIDINQEFIDFCESNKSRNETFICTDFLSFDGLPVESVSGIWSSFSLSYLHDPLDFLISVHSSLNQGGWIALLDVSCFISGNLAKNSKYYERVRCFELESYKSGIYDFNFGAKMQGLLESAGFEIVYVDNDVSDPELNFSGEAPQEIIEGWVARLNRMQRLKEELEPEYAEFRKELLAGLGSEDHDKRENVRFVVAIKSNKSIQPTANASAE
ncbi:class I SAM-dependent methyltransferase [Aeromonas hydrophila]|uniref:class I SAM-dependent DNA methyltransferase n=1 Tax=Aeromonas hydrophila TaxID=644 RepID=UPI00107EDC83|nr:class I SAM-dependent methyltransferase [Aeromonas hydrophila]QBX71892.1 class I SAM-dependent methyltransferase [Aeromonas hydrophila]QBX76591.1 class I SAM-dependent methyltransferase [Aeromonas hydrophila]